LLVLVGEFRYGSQLLPHGLRWETGQAQWALITEIAVSFRQFSWEHPVDTNALAGLPHPVCRTLFAAF
jgi:hypothetical protein